jgi:hypothetical protein
VASVSSAKEEEIGDVRDKSLIRRDEMVKTAYVQDNKKHTFVDWTLIEPGYGLSWMTGMGGWEVPHGIRISAHRPRVDLQPIIVPEKPWEASLGNYSILFEDQGLYRFYYKCGARGAKADGPSVSMLAYAESKDGVNWEKPSIGTVTFEGSTDNNLVFGLDAAQGRAVMHPCVFIDPSASPDERYKLTYNDVVDGKDHIYGAVSPDGLHWKDLPQPLLSGYHSDTQNVIRFDQDRGRYVGYFRGWTLYERTATEDGKMFRDPETGRAESWPVLHGRRTIAYAETERFESWPVPRPIFATDPDDPPDLDIYTNAYSPWPDSGSHLMFPTFYRRNQDITEVVMSDAGQSHNPMPPEAVWLYAQGLYEKGVSPANVEKLIGATPKALLGI